MEELLGAPHQISLQEAIDEQERALGRHAQNANEDWMRRAEAIVLSFSPGRRFLAEEISQALRGEGFSTHDNRAMGLVIKRLAKRGVIRAVGARKAATSHGSLKPLWERQE